MKLYPNLCLALMVMLLSISPCFARVKASRTVFSNFQEGKILEGFQVKALYIDDNGAPLGARLVHERSGFVLDLLQIQSVPQGFIWVNSWPTSDMGEPHTQEHLLLGKGNKGRNFASREEMALTESSAFTDQWRTCYDFYSAAGSDVFYSLLEKRLDALLHPDYTDEEIRREVCHFGIVENPTDHTLRLEEKGTIYNEMVSTFERPWSRIGREMGIAVYGPAHPLAMDSGGLPEAVRRVTPQDNRAFHAANYHLGNMGMITTLPKEMDPVEALRLIGAMLERLETDAAKRRGTFRTPDQFPAPHGAPEGQVRIVPYPDENPQNPSLLLLSWPADMHFELRDQLLLELFADAFGGDPTTNLYKKFIDSRTREIDIGATSAFAWVSDEPGHPFGVGFGNVAVAHLTEAKVSEVRQRVMAEIERLAALADASPELLEFNTRILSRLVDQRRSLSKFVNSPPGFGFRETGSGWLSHLERLNRTSDFRKSLTFQDHLGWIETLLASKKNIWRELLQRHHFLGITPYAVAARPDPGLLKRGADERKTRLAGEVARLKERYGTTPDQETIQRYSHDYDAATAELKKAEIAGENLRFLDQPPLSLDDQLNFRTIALGSGVPAVVSTFTNMSSATTGAAFRLEAIPADQRMYLAILPALLTRVGVIDASRPVPYEEMSERLRREVLSLNAYFSTNGHTGRCELVVSGSGNTTPESRRAVQWMELVAFHPDWRLENLPRIRDVVDQSLTGLHTQMQGPEEYWVSDPANAWARQNNPLLMATSSFLTKEHNAFRLRWQLKEVGADREAVVAFLSLLAAAGGKASRAELQALATVLASEMPDPALVAEPLRPLIQHYEKLSTGAKSVVRDAGHDLGQYITDLPEATLSADWVYLCTRMRDDLQVGPARVLATLEEVRTWIFNTKRARMFLVGSKASQDALLDGPIPGLLSKLAVTASPKAGPGPETPITDRLRERYPSADPIFVGLVNPNTQSGVFVNSAPAAAYTETDRESLLRLLAAEIYSGHGAHSLFMKTWGAGLAYSNGLRVTIPRGEIGYYAERCPELPLTLRFVIDELKRDRRDPGLVEYSLAMVFRGQRAASTYEERAESMAADLADGVTPEVVKRFYTAVLALRKSPELAREIYDRLPLVCGQVLPGFVTKAAEVKGGRFFVIGPEKQMRLYEQYLQSVEGPGTVLYRLYPRDFWMK